MRQSISAKAALAALGLATALAAAAPASAQDAGTTSLRVANFGGAFHDLQRKYAAHLFTRRTGIKVEFIDGNDRDHVAKLAAAKGTNVPFDVVYLDDDVHAQAIKLKLIQKFDPELVPNAKRLIDGALDEYGPLFQYNSMGIGYNAEKFAAAGIPVPTSWEDLWSEKLAGRVAVPELGHPAGRAFLIQATRIAGGDENTLEKGIDKIAKLKAHSYYTSTTQVEALFQTGDIWATIIANGRLWNLATRFPAVKFVNPKEGGVLSASRIDIVAGTPNAKAANLYVNSVIDPLHQLGQVAELSFGPYNKDIAALVPNYPEFATKIARYDELYVPKWDAVNANLDKAVALWARRVAR